MNGDDGNDDDDDDDDDDNISISIYREVYSAVFRNTANMHVFFSSVGSYVTFFCTIKIFNL